VAAGRRRGDRHPRDHAVRQLLRRQHGDGALAAERERRAGGVGTVLLADVEATGRTVHWVRVKGHLAPQPTTPGKGTQPRAGALLPGPRR
jgi:hypothetical protein